MRNLVSWGARRRQKCAQSDCSTRTSEQNKKTNTNSIVLGRYLMIRHGKLVRRHKGTSDIQEALISIFVFSLAVSQRVAIESSWGANVCTAVCHRTNVYIRTTKNDNNNVGKHTSHTCTYSHTMLVHISHVVAYSNIVYCVLTIRDPIWGAHTRVEHTLGAKYIFYQLYIWIMCVDYKCQVSRVLSLNFIYADKLLITICTQIKNLIGSIIWFSMLFNLWFYLNFPCFFHCY